MKDIVVDFETFYDKKEGISVTQQGNANYARTADAYIVSIVSDDIKWCGTIPEAQAKFPASFWADPEHRFIAANSGFDQTFAEKYGMHTAKPWKCVLDLAKFHQLPQNLASALQVTFGTKLDKTLREEMNGVDFFQLPVEKQEALKTYCLNDSVETLRLWKKLPPMTDVEDRIADYTRMTNRRGVAVNVDLVEKDKTRLSEMRFRAFNLIPWHATDRPLSYQALCRWANNKGIKVPESLAKTDDECAELMGLQPELNEVVRNMRNFRRTNTLLEKANALLERVTPEGILPLDLLYCGARHTRRWSSQGFNVQNLDKEPFKVADLDVWTRRWLVPRPGKVFLILDFSQIEPRCLNWLVGNEEMLAAMRAGFGIYEAHARATMGWKGGSLKKEDADLYKLSKARCLGAGYGAGASKFVTIAKTMAGLDITPEESQAAVKGFRDSNPKIVAYWRFFDDLIRRAVRENDKTLSIQLPTGDFLKHFHLASRLERKNGKASAAYQSCSIHGDFGPNSMKKNLWGGVLTENVTQRFARDVLAEAVLRVEAAGYPVPWQSHDEAIIEVDDTPTARKTALEEVTQIMKTPPEWCSDLPLDVEGDFSPHYTK